MSGTPSGHGSSLLPLCATLCIRWGFGFFGSCPTYEVSFPGSWDEMTSCLAKSSKWSQMAANFSQKGLGPEFEVGTEKSMALYPIAGTVQILHDSVHQSLLINCWRVLVPVQYVHVSDYQKPSWRLGPHAVSPSLVSEAYG